MKVAIFTETYFPFISGVVTHIKTLKESLEHAGHEVLIVTTSPKAVCHYVKDGVLYCPAIPLKRIYGYGLSNPVNIQRLRIIQDFDPDIIHIHTEFSMGIFAQFAARKLKKPIVYTLHTMYDDYMFYVAPERFQNMVKPAAHVYFRKVANKATEIIGPSLKVVEFLRRCGVERHINIIPIQWIFPTLCPKTSRATTLPPSGQSWASVTGIRPCVLWAVWARKKASTCWWSFLLRISAGPTLTSCSS
ncbi:MAG: glycosyltransferase [Ruthenibacterium lactatiformans]